MTDKAAVEVPAPVSGRVVSITGAPGDKVAVGSPLIVFEVGAAAAPAESALRRRAPAAAGAPASRARRRRRAPAGHGSSGGAARASAPAAAAGPRPRQPAGSWPRRRIGGARAKPASIWRRVVGTGPGGRIVRDDLAAASGARAAAAKLRRCAARGSPRRIGSGDVRDQSHRPAPADRRTHERGQAHHSAFRLCRGSRCHRARSAAAALERQAREGRSRRSRYLPLIVMALDAGARIVPAMQCAVRRRARRAGASSRRARRHRHADSGRTQSPGGAQCPVVGACAKLAAEIRRVAERARTNKATREELVGSTITVTSLGKLGGIASTPIINAPEVAIIGLNKAVDRPVVHQGAVAVRRIMNLSSSFDHRFVDGYDAAAMIQALKELLEHPAMIFIPKVNPMTAQPQRHCATPATRLRYGARPLTWPWPPITTAAGANPSSSRSAPIELSPAAHVLHYASTCFEGFKAFRRADGSVHIFRMDRHIQRMRQSARQLVLPEPDAAQLADMVRAVITRCRDAVPEAPGALYLRPILFGTTANIGAAATPASDALLAGARKPGVGLFRRRHEAAAHPGRRREHALGGADGHGEDRRQLRRGDGPHLERAGEVSRSTKCCSVRAARCRRPAPPTSC